MTTLLDENLKHLREEEKQGTIETSELQGINAFSAVSTENSLKTYSGSQKRKGLIEKFLIPLQRLLNFRFSADIYHIDSEGKEFLEKSRCYGKEKYQLSYID